jgi:hypothetical protein
MANTFEDSLNSLIGVLVDKTADKTLRWQEGDRIGEYSLLIQYSGRFIIRNTGVLVIQDRSGRTCEEIKPIGFLEHNLNCLRKTVEKNVEVRKRALDELLSSMLQELGVDLKDQVS